MILFCDLDGVLVDFEKGILELTGKAIEEQSAKDMWTSAAKASNFFSDLEWMEDGKHLWANIVHNDPIILTGIPYGGWASQQKRDWCNDNLGSSIGVITCWSRDKHTFATPGDILIDDRISAKEKWVNAGGIFVHHTSAEETLDELETIFR